MVSTRQLILDIRQLLSLEGSIEEAMIDRLGEAYLAACKAVGDKAQKCLELVRQGQRSKAIKLAKELPDLRSEVEELDFEELVEWQMTCEMIGLSTIGSFDAEALRSVISEVYAETTTFDSLLTTFRRMCLGRAPISEQVRTLRAIVAADPATGDWKDDLRGFETAYVESLLHEAQHANRHVDLPAMEAVLAELSNGRWLPPEPTRAAAAVKKLIRPHQERFASERYSELSQQLHEAHSAMDENRCRALFDEWAQVAERTECPAGADAEEDVAPIRSWLADLQAVQEEAQAYVAACQQLESAIDENQEPAELEKLASDILRFDRGLPEVLAARFTSRMEEHTRRSKRRFTLMVTGIVCAVLLVAGAVTGFVIWQRYESDVAQWEERITTALESGDLTGAGRLLSTLDNEKSWIRGNATIEALRTTWEQKDRAEQQRAADFRKAMDAVVAAGAESPAQDAMDRAVRLALTYEEKSQVEDWRQKIQRHKDARRRELEQERQKELDKIEALYTTVAPARDSDEAGAATIEDTCMAMASDLLAREGVSSVQRIRVDAIRRAILESRQRLQAQTELRQRIDRAKGNLALLVERPADLASGLLSFAKTFPESPASTDFARAASMVGHWQAAIAWQKLVSSWGGSLRMSGAASFKNRLGQTQQYVAKFPDGPYTVTARAYVAYLQSGVNAFPGRKLNHTKETRDLLRKPMLLNMQAVRTKDNRVFYCEKQDDVVESKRNGKTIAYNLAYVVNAATLEKRRITLEPDKIDKPLHAAPHSVLAMAMLKEIRFLEAKKNRGWETLYLRLAEMVRKQDDMDRILQAILLRQMLRHAAETTPFVSAKIQELASEFDGVDLDVAWADPDDNDARRTRPQAADVVQAIPSLQNLLSRVEDSLKSLDGMARVVRPVGVLLGQQCTLRGFGTGANCSVYVLWSETGQSPRLCQIGTAKNGVLVVEAAQVNKYPLGSLLFVTVK
ncbi:MAG: hypothetical protein GWP08_17750 [Nitrospiraceae bacterium]|nr:hypothetical protein [Nitrospiraceae bacterium]